MKQLDWHNVSAKAVFDALKSGKKGLTKIQAKKRLGNDGLNALPEPKRPSGWSIFFSQFKGSLTILLVMAGFTAWALGEESDAIIIAITVLITVMFGFVQEYRAERAFRLLKSLLALTARVIRDGGETQIPLSDVVVGDVLVLQAGDRVPADARLFKTNNFEVVEAELTGESSPSKKSAQAVDVGVGLPDRTNMCFQGTVIASGEALGVVVATGSHTEFAKIAQKLGEIEDPVTPLQQNLKQFVRWLTIVILVMIAVLFIISMLKGVGLVLSLETAIAVAVSSIPEGLVISVTAMLALGARQMLEDQVLIRNLLAVETLGAVTVICTDKTGTLTQGAMVMTEMMSVSSDKDLLKALYFGSGVRVENSMDKPEKWNLFGTPTEQALFSYAVTRGLASQEKDRVRNRLDMIPFDSKYKFRATLYEHDGAPTAYLVGAPERLLAQADMSAPERKKWANEISRRSNEGMRVIGAARFVVKNESGRFGDVADVMKQKLEFLGIGVIADPLRDSVVDSIAKAQEAGVRVIMITGDNPKTALAIAHDAGIVAQEADVIDGAAIMKMSDVELGKCLKKTSVFARISPLDKLRIIEALQKQKHVVAMTGDGINDTAALKKAEIGVAVGTAHDIAKHSADMVLLDNDFNSIVEAIRGGRRIFSNVQKVVTFLLFGSFTAAVAIICSLLFGLPLPFLPAQILWVNIIEDALPGLAYVFEPAEENQMHSGPRPVNAPLLAPVSKTIIFGVGLISSILLFITFYWLYYRTGDIVYARSVSFVILGIDTFFTAFALKSLTRPIYTINPFNNPALLLSLGVSYAFYFIALYVPVFRDLLRVVPLDGFGWMVVFIVGLVNLVMVEIVKAIFARQKFV